MSKIYENFLPKTSKRFLKGSRVPTTHNTIKQTAFYDCQSTPQSSHSRLKYESYRSKGNRIWTFILLFIHLYHTTLEKMIHKNSIFFDYLLTTYIIYNIVINMNTYQFVYSYKLFINSNLFTVINLFIVLLICLYYTWMFKYVS